MALTIARRRDPWFPPRPIEIQKTEVRIQVKRLTIDELSEFKLDFGEFMQQGRRGVPVRHGGEEGLTDDQVWERRLLLDEGERVADRDRLRQRRSRIIAFWCRTLTDYVQVVPGELQDESSQSITAGADLWSLLQDDDTVIGQCVLSVYMENTLSEDDKKKLPSWLDLLRSLRGPAKTVTGDAPASTAANVESSSSAVSEDVTDATGNDPSGSMVH